MADHANIESALVAGRTARLKSLFADWKLVQVEASGGCHYPTDLLPNHVIDPQCIADPLLALVSCDRHGRFEPSAHAVSSMAHPVKA